MICKWKNHWHDSADILHVPEFYRAWINWELDWLPTSNDNYDSRRFTILFTISLTFCSTATCYLQFPQIYFCRISFAKKSKEKKCYFSFTNFFVCASSNFLQKNTRWEEKNNFIISAATCVRRQCEAKKCSERFQGFLNMKKSYFI